MEKDHKDLSAFAAVENARSASDSDAATARHTEGPWEVGSDFVGPLKVMTTKDRYVVAHVGATKYVDALANAQLIAAAPELLEALRKIARWHGEFPETTRTTSACRRCARVLWCYGSNGERDFMRQIALNAIAKAEGR